jgi:hypothetical protein
MPFPRPVDQILHGVTDYTAGTTLITVFPRLAGISGSRAARQIRTAGVIHLGYSTLTDYPLGVIKLIPYKAHLMIDAIGAAGLAATPFVTGQWKRGRDQWLPHIALSVFEFVSLALSDPTGRGDYHGDVEAVRRANMEDPRRKIDEGPRAVQPAAAS